MLAAASVAEPMAKPRQNARLCHIDEGLGAAAAGAAIAASMRDQCCCGGATGATASASPPSRSSQNATSDASAGSCARRRSTSRRSVGAEHAQHVFGGNEVAAVGRAYGVVVAHPSRQALSFNSPRRIQLFIVPSGTLMRAASSS